MSSTLLATVRRTLLKDMLNSVPGEWKVLIMDSLTTRIMSSACKMSDILEEGVSLVEDVCKDRQPMPEMPGIYFISPTVESIQRLCKDFKTEIQYQSAHVFFSSNILPSDLAEIRRHPLLVKVLKSLKEVSCEILTVDSRTFTTDQPNALCDLFGDKAVGTSEHETAINVAATRLATLFTTLKEFPTVRYKVGKQTNERDPAGAAARSLVAQTVASRVHALLAEGQQSGLVPSNETCDLIVVDRSIDTVSPIIHEWTYEALAYDLLPIQGNMYEYTSENRKGEKEKKEYYLDERDPLWVNLRHQFIADASNNVTKQLNNFMSQNKATGAGGRGGKTSSSQLKSIVQSLGEYNNEVARLSLHIDMASNINALTSNMKLDEIGLLEQDLIYGTSSSKQVIEMLSQRQDLHEIDKVRLLMSFVATHPEKLDSTKSKQWQKIANLKDKHMHAISNLEYLGVAVYKRDSGSTGLNFGGKKKRQTRKLRTNEDGEEQWELSRYQPVLSEVVEDLAKNSLSESEFPYVSKPSGGHSATSAKSSLGSVRSKQSSVGWGKRAQSQQSDALDINSIKLQGKRLVVFVLGGVTRGEMRTSYTMSKLLGRDVLLGSTSVETPKSFVDKMYDLSPLKTEADA